MTNTGFQGGEGCGTAGEWNVENVFEELDAPNEWFYDEDKKDLYVLILRPVRTSYGICYFSMQLIEFT